MSWILGVEMEWGVEETQSSGLVTVWNNYKERSAVDFGVLE